MISSLRLLLALVFVFSFSTHTFAAESLEQTIDYLIDYVGKSNTTFIRNGETHTPAEAVAHIKAKYEHFKSEIKTPEDFIRLSASKSLLTGKTPSRTPEERMLSSVANRCLNHTPHNPK